MERKLGRDGLDVGVRMDFKGNEIQGVRKGRKEECWEKAEINWIFVD
jgi:hypothetical protein